jgi:hypothetical protein
LEQRKQKVERKKERKKKTGKKEEDQPKIILRFFSITPMRRCMIALNKQQCFSISSIAL